MPFTFLKIGPGANISFELCLGMVDLGEVATTYLKAISDAASEVKVRSRIYSPAVVVWLMILQRLLPRGVMGEAVGWLSSGNAGPIAGRCKRVRENRISAATGAYCRARQQLPKMVVSQMSDHILERLQAEFGQNWPKLEGQAVVLDGSSLQLQHCPGIVKKYPPAVNQKGTSHWPILKIVVAHDVLTGLAHRPEWGAMYGPEAVSEQALAKRIIRELPPKSTILGDRNFGVFAMVAAADEAGHTVLFRLMADRAKKIAGHAIGSETDEAVVWKPSEYDRSAAKKNGVTLPDGIAGRLIVLPMGRGKSKEWLYLFSTLRNLEPAELAELYQCRWNIETDLRSLKQSVKLQRISTRSVDVLEKELLVACSAYNLVRAVMCLAARKAGIAARSLSFTRVRDIVQPSLASLLDPAQQEKALERVLRYASTCRLPNRSHPRAYPRKVWGSGYRYPARQTSDAPQK